MRTKAILHAHSRRRAKERYQLKFSKSVRRQMEADIASHYRDRRHVRRGDFRGDPTRAQLVMRRRMGRSIWSVAHNGRCYLVVYDHRRKAIVTFLPPEPVLLAGVSGHSAIAAVIEVDETGHRHIVPVTESMRAVARQVSPTGEA